MPSIILLSVWKNFGYNMLVFLAGLQAIPEEVYEAGALDGAARRWVGPRRPGADRGARRPGGGDAVDDPALGLEDLRLQHAGLPRRAPGDPRGALRGRGPRRRRRLAPVPPRHPADARADV